MIKITVCGACGRMGTTILELALNDNEIKIVGLIESPTHPSIGKKINDVEVKSNLREVINETDVVIEFTTPEATFEHLKIIKEYKKPMVIGTTGLSQEILEMIKETSKVAPILVSPNMSIGVNLLFKLIENIAKTIPDYDVEIIELHHNKKKDAPSGTALKFAQIITNTLNKNLEEMAIYGRKGITGPRKKDELGIHAIRAGDIIGEHTIIFAGTGERIEITHRAHSRYTFAAGALKSAKWIVNQPPGLYDISDVLQLK